MILRQLICFALLYGLIGGLMSPVWLAAAENTESEFRSVLEIADLGEDTLAKFSGGPSYKEKDWQLFAQLFYRLGQHSEDQLARWTKPWDTKGKLAIGDLYEVTGEVVSVERLDFPEDLSSLQKQSELYRCQIRSEVLAAELTVLTLSIPKRWANRDLTVGEPVRFRGILLKNADANEQQDTVLLTDRLAWYPLQEVSSGLILLASQGMDVSLLDEVVHRKPFVNSTVSREGAAFYACLATVGKIDASELATLAQQNVAIVAEKWRKQRVSLAKQREILVEKNSQTTDEAQQKLLAQQTKIVSRQLALAEAVLERSKVGVSSVAPLFLQPEREVGELVRLEGIARRAVRIAETGLPGIEEYYELEIFPPDSQDLPIVCCTTRLPPGFPLGDEIREPVRVSGVFFKSWQYRSRKLVSTNGETKRQQRLYTPIIVTGEPVRLLNTVSKSQWGLWGGVAFLAVLVILWINLARIARRERRERSASRQSKVLEMQPPTLSGDDLPEIKT